MMAIVGSPLIRPAREEDLTRILEVERAGFSTPWSRPSFQSLLGSDQVFMRVVEVEGRVVAHGVLWRVDDEGEVANLAVDPEYRGQGLGSLLLDHLLEEAAQAGVTRVFLEVRVSNTEARELYRKRGFRPVGIRPDYYRSPREDALVLRKELTPD